MSVNILIVDDDDITRESLAITLTNRGFVCSQAANGVEGLEHIKNNDIDVVITDIEMPEMDGIELLEEAVKLNLPPTFIIITAYASLETAIEALRTGAFDYMLKPLNFGDVAIKVQKLIEHKELVRENMALRNEIHRQYDFSNIVGKSQAIQNVFNTIKKVSTSESNVLITGNSGTGKELVAKAIHFNSPHHQGPFVAVNCGAITETLIESELFGHKKGAFTGAVADKEGLFKAAHRGTLFLDEIAELSLTAQAKLLRVVETNVILPVGSTSPQKVHVRLIAATNCNLQQAVSKGTFREDLYYRLNVIEVNLPSLVERKEDIPLLVNHFIKKYNREMNKQVEKVEGKLMYYLTTKEWRGEVRELENFIERLMIFADGSELHADNVPNDFLGAPETPDIKMPKTSALKKAIEEFEREFLIIQLKKHEFHKAETAKALEIGEATLYRKLAQYGIEE